MRRGATGVVLALVGLAAACSGDASTVVPEGFASRVAVVTAPDGSGVVEHCLWIADTPERRARGLMGVTELGPAVGMAFVNDAPTTGRFWMKDTSIPLSIAFFDQAGVHLGAVDMEPCTAADPADCPRYDTPSGYTVALEVPLGTAEGLGLVPGSSVGITDRPCDD
ncbi:MAG: hypothetical protein RIR49_328 [Actinomycetota bacterium]